MICPVPSPKNLQEAFWRVDALGRGRCSKGVDLVLDCHPQLVAIDEEPDHEIVHGRRFGEANGAAHQTLTPGPQIDVFALDSRHVLFAHSVLRRIEMALG